MFIQVLPAFVSGTDAFKRFDGQGYAALLNSGGAIGPASRFDIAAVNPEFFVNLHSNGKAERIAANGQSRSLIEHWPTWLAGFLAEKQETLAHANPALPFTGGFIGHLNYEAFDDLYGLAGAGHSTQGWLGYYPAAVVSDRHRQQTVVVGETQQQLDSLLALLETEPAAAPGFRLTSNFTPNTEKPHYLVAVERIKQYLSSGDCYQVNLAQRFEARCEGDSRAAYLALLDAANCPFSAYLETPEADMLCLSPERFLLKEGDHLFSRPIKGTRKRHAVPAVDDTLRQTLYESAKDRAENLMIVDLLRNDLGKVSVPGSVKVDELFTIESYANVHQMVSQISSRLAPGETPVSLLQATFPGGSITGAPKKRAMEVIRELEPHPREIYCGSIFYISNHGRMDSNIAIRTLMRKDDHIYCWGGGGIVMDSDPEAEYEESIIKVKNLMDCLENLERPK